jgi:predicted RecB family endonuclease
VENACLAYAWNAGQRVSYWREEPLEIDGVLEGSWGAWAIEVKTGRIAVADLKGLAEFARRFKKFRPLVVCDEAARVVAERAGFEAMAWTDFLLRGPPRPTAGG